MPRNRADVACDSQKVYGQVMFTEAVDEKDVTVEIELTASAALMDRPGWRLVSINLAGRRASLVLRAEENLG